MPFIVVDDGSKDDSVDIISNYDDRIDRFIRKDKNAGLTPAMTEAADILINDYGCDVICRFDADIEFITSGWDLRFLRCFDHNRKVAAVGACQVTPFGAVWALGDMLIHPKGYCHILGIQENPQNGSYQPSIMISGNQILPNVDCDSVMGCLAAFRANAYQRVGGLRDEFTELRGETEDLNLRLLLEGYQCQALGSVVFIHRHMEHQGKNSIYDSPEKDQRSLDVWETLWGWNKITPDLNKIYERWGNTALARHLFKNPQTTMTEYIGP